LWAARGSVVVQLPFWNVAPFLLGGAGAMGVSSPAILLGNDVDPAAHWGGGVKIFLNRYVGLRVEARHVIAAREATQRSQVSHVEVLGGFFVTLGRKKPVPLPPPDPDRDDDGFPNERDTCPDVPGVSPDGCPPRDSDEDGFIDSEDACPYEKGVEPDGCPTRDQDGDGITDDRDQCIDRPETDNGYQDEDGCPDELPEEIKEFQGVIEGIEFELDSAIIREGSKPILDRAVKVLRDYGDIRIEIVGHTDDQGTPEYNEKLSRERAEAVEKYFVDQGIDDARLETRGAGEKEPLTSNATEDGRAKNRRTEFKILRRERASTP
jgi:outer membrane protein OmpA-like peptidoglycan-associated protein